MAFRIIKNTKGTSSLFHTKLGGEKKSKTKEIRSPHIIFPAQTRFKAVGKWWNTIRTQPAFLTSLGFFSQGLQTFRLHHLRRWRRVQVSCERCQDAFCSCSGRFTTHTSPPNPIQAIFLPLSNLFICQAAAGIMEAFKGGSFKENHCSFYVRPKFSFSHNLLEPSWHFPPSRKKKRRRVEHGHMV